MSGSKSAETMIYENACTHEGSLRAEGIIVILSPGNIEERIPKVMIIFFESLEKLQSASYPNRANWAIGKINLQILIVKLAS